MPNLSFDIFYNPDIINLSASRSGAAPRAKPDWKVRRAPKLAPKQKPTPSSTFGPNNTAQSLDEDQRRSKETTNQQSDSRKGTSPAPKKLGPKTAQQTADRKAEDTKEGLAGVAQEEKALKQGKKTPPKLKNSKTGQSEGSKKLPPKLSRAS